MYTCYICDYQTTDKIKFKVHANTTNHASRTANFFINTKGSKGINPVDSRKFETIHKLAILNKKDVIEYISDIISESKMRSTTQNRLFNFITYSESSEPRKMIAEQNKRRIILNEIIHAPIHGKCDCNKCKSKRIQVHLLRSEPNDNLKGKDPKKVYEINIIRLVEVLYSKLLRYKDEHYDFFNEFGKLYFELFDNKDVGELAQKILILTNGDYKNIATPYRKAKRNERIEFMTAYDNIQMAILSYNTFMDEYKNNRKNIQGITEKYKHTKMKYLNKIAARVRGNIGIDFRIFNMLNYSPTVLRKAKYMKLCEKVCVFNRDLNDCENTEDCTCSNCTLHENDEKHIKNKIKRYICDRITENFYSPDDYISKDDKIFSPDDYSKDYYSSKEKELRENPKPISCDDKFNMMFSRYFSDVKPPNPDYIINPKSNVIISNNSGNYETQHSTTQTFTTTTNTTQSKDKEYADLSKLIQEKAQNGEWTEFSNLIMKQVNMSGLNLNGENNENIIINNYDGMSEINKNNDINIMPSNKSNPFEIMFNDNNSDFTDDCSSDDDNNDDAQSDVSSTISEEKNPFPNLFIMKLKDYKDMRNKVFNYSLINVSDEKTLYGCIHCDKQYKFFSGVKRHTKTKHNIDLVEYNSENSFCDNIDKFPDLDDEMIEFYLFDLYYKYPHIYYQMIHDYGDIIPTFEKQYGNSISNDELRLKIVRFMFENREKYIKIGEESSNELEMKKLYNIDLHE